MMRENINWIALLITIGGCSFILILKNIRKRYGKKRPFVKFIPEILLLVIIGIVLSASLRISENYGIAILGHMDTNLPSPLWPAFGGVNGVRSHLSPAVTIGIIGFVESSVVAKMYAAKHNYYVSPNRELVALGISNIIGSFFRTYPTFGSLPRSYVADTMGAQSQVFSLVAAFIVMLTILLLGPVFYFLPKVVMASVIIVAAIGLIELEDLAFLWKMKVLLSREIYLSDML